MFLSTVSLICTTKRALPGKYRVGASGTTMAVPIFVAKEWRVAPIDYGFIISFFASYYVMEIICGLRGMEKYHLYSGQNCIEVVSRSLLTLLFNHMKL